MPTDNDESTNTKVSASAQGVGETSGIIARMRQAAKYVEQIRESVGFALGSVLESAQRVWSKARRVSSDTTNAGEEMDVKAGEVVPPVLAHDEREDSSTVASAPSPREQDMAVKRVDSPSTPSSTEDLSSKRSSESATPFAFEEVQKPTSPEDEEDDADFVITFGDESDEDDPDHISTASVIHDDIPDDSDPLSEGAIVLGDGPEVGTPTTVGTRETSTQTAPEKTTASTQTPPPQATVGTQTGPEFIKAVRRPLAQTTTPRDAPAVEDELVDIMSQGHPERQAVAEAWSDVASPGRSSVASLSTRSSTPSETPSETASYVVTVRMPTIQPSSKPSTGPSAVSLTVSDLGGSGTKPTSSPQEPPAQQRDTPARSKPFTDTVVEAYNDVYDPGSTGAYSEGHARPVPNAQDGSVQVTFTGKDDMQQFFKKYAQQHGDQSFSVHDSTGQEVFKYEAKPELGTDMKQGMQNLRNSQQPVGSSEPDPKPGQEPS